MVGDGKSQIDGYFYEPDMSFQHPAPHSLHSL